MPGHALGGLGIDVCLSHWLCTLKKAVIGGGQARVMLVSFGFEFENFGF